MKRTYCGQLSKELINQNIKICGWIKNIRNLGSLLFLEVQDITGRIQCVISDSNVDASKLTRETTVSIDGLLLKRKSINNKVLNGDLEIDVKNIKIYSIAKTPPLIIEENTDALEEVRFENRYLDLRRENIQKIFLFRSKLLQKIHEFLSNKSFNYIETPILGKPTPEGARDYLVPSRIKKGNFYALPQSPQIYKQLLMVAGYDKYYQIAKCFRDEDLRSDRQPEFTQLDMELSFVEEEDIYQLIEEMMVFLFEQMLDIKLSTPFEKMEYDYAMFHYGNDKPDTRFKNLIVDSTNIVKKCKDDFFKDKEQIRTLGFDIQISRSELDNLDNELKKANYGSSFYIKKNKEGYSGSLSKRIEPEVIDEIFKQHNLDEGIIFFNFGNDDNISVKLGFIRTFIGNNKLNLNPKQYNFLWIINWPLYEYDSEENRYVAAHHPFTQPKIENHHDFYTNQSKARARSYDLVLNGLELGGGSIRIIDEEMQKQMFESIGLSKEEYEVKFETLLNAFKYGVPPHAGIAFGIDRMIQIMLNLNNIKECIAFPKNTKAYDQTIKTPSEIDTKSLEELSIQIIKEK